jgi:hypothetical protein
MFYAYETEAGRFVLERQFFTLSAWELLLNGQFIDSYLDPAEAALDIGRHAERLGIYDPLLLPPFSLSGWEIHWVHGHDGDAPELWVHRLYLEGKSGGRRVSGAG